LIHLILVSKGTYDNPPSGTPSANVKVPYLYPCPYALTNLALEAGVTAPLVWSAAVILDKNGNKYEYIPSIGSGGSAPSLTNKSHVALIRKKLVDAAHASGLYPPYTSVSFPNGGEELLCNFATNILWDAANLGGNVRIELYKAGVLNSIITASATNTGTYSWSIPADHTEGTDFKIRVIPLNSTNKFDNSNTNFTIRSLRTTVYYPNGGEKLVANKGVNITWNPDILAGNVDIDLYKSGFRCSTIATNTANDGTSTWTIPAGLRYDTNYTVRVKSQIYPLSADSSDAGFEITPRPAIYSADMSTNPGWKYDTGWNWGKPQGRNGDGIGYSDPASGYTSSNVVGFKLDGDYGNIASGTRYATITNIDCRGYSSVELQFMRWLGVDRRTNDCADIQVSSTGTNWVTIWTNSATIDDGAWIRCNYDISAIADGQAKVFVRWGLGPTDGSVNYCGWNIDDVQIVGVPQHTTNWTPYIWLAANGITNNQEAADLLDSDGDGALNWQEYLTGTSPTNPNSVFCILDATFNLTANSISWYGTTNSGVTSDFVVYRTTNLVGVSWVPVGASSRSPSGTNVWLDTSLPAEGVPVYYRLAVP